MGRVLAVEITGTVSVEAIAGVVANVATTVDVLSLRLGKIVRTSPASAALTEASVEESAFDLVAWCFLDLLVEVE